MSSGAGVVMMNGGGGSNSNIWGRGTKRAADESNLNDLERFEKRLRLLSLREQENGRRHLYTPVSTLQSNHETAVGTRKRSEPRQRRSNPVKAPDEDEHMQLDDHPNRVYIHDLDAELASDSESDGEKLIFLPDIEKRFSRLPHQVLTNSTEINQELVLYAVPKSLSVDEGHDSVRKAIIEARARAREKAVDDARARQEVMERQYDQSSIADGVESAHGYGGAYLCVDEGQEGDEDGDAMDID